MEKRFEELIRSLHEKRMKENAWRGMVTKEQVDEETQEVLKTLAAFAVEFHKKNINV